MDKFFVQNGRQIVIEPVPGIEEAVIRSLILGASLSVLLRQRRFLVLHASCVTLENSAVAFLGHSGWGKSLQRKFSLDALPDLVKLIEEDIKEAVCTI